MTTSLVSNQKPHAVFVPYPAQGHITPLHKLAKLFHYKGFHITFVNSEYNHKRLCRSLGEESIKGLPSFRFEAIPDGLPPSDTEDSTQDIPALCESTRRTCLGPFSELLIRLNDTSLSNVPKVSCIVADTFMSFTLAAAKEFNIPHVSFWTASTCGLIGYSQFRNFINKGIFPLKDTQESLNIEIDWIASMKGIRIKDFPTFVRSTDPDEFMLHFDLTEVEKAVNSSAIVINSFNDLELEFLEALPLNYPPVYNIGPLQLLLNQIPPEDAVNSIKSNLWKEQDNCLEWLDTREPNSVIYVNFGSITVLTDKQLIEFAWGLANSEIAFLWVIRPDLVKGEKAILPQDFVWKTEKRSLIASWCSQERVLDHPSIGGFLTHCGWNSTLESLSSGVPMLCWPFFCEQVTNCWSCVNKWKVGLEIEAEAKRDEIERLVRELMCGEQGKVLKKNALRWKLLAEKAASDTGSSYLNLVKIIEHVLHI